MGVYGLFGLTKELPAAKLPWLLTDSACLNWIRNIRNETDFQGQRSLADKFTTESSNKTAQAATSHFDRGNPGLWQISKNRQSVNKRSHAKGLKQASNFDLNDMRQRPVGVATDALHP